MRPMHFNLQKSLGSVMTLKSSSSAPREENKKSGISLPIVRRWIYFNCPARGLGVSAASCVLHLCSCRAWGFGSLSPICLKMTREASRVIDKTTNRKSRQDKCHAETNSTLNDVELLLMNRRYNTFAISSQFRRLPRRKRNFDMIQ